MTKINGLGHPQAISVPEFGEVGDSRIIRAACNAALARRGLNAKRDFNERYKEGAFARFNTNGVVRVARVKRSQMSRFQRDFPRTKNQQRQPTT